MKIEKIKEIVSEWKAQAKIREKWKNKGKREFDARKKKIKKGNVKRKRERGTERKGKRIYERGVGGNKKIC